MAAQIRARAVPKRQAWRRALLALSFIAFPVTMNYFSPYLIVDGGFRGVLTGSAIVFASMFIGAMIFGRLFCGWLCPAAGLQEPLERVNSRRVARRVDLVKWLIWVPWIALIVFAVVRAGGYHDVDPLYGTVGGISVAGAADRPIIFAYVIYFGVVGLFFALAALLGRRGGCHAVCWMAPFMILGREVRNRLGAWPSLRLKADSAACNACGRCTVECPMSIDVAELALSGHMEHPQCVLCGSCVDACPQAALCYSFSSGK